MPGLFGIFDKTGGESPDALVRLGRRMADAMCHQPWLNTELTQEGSFCSGRVHLGIFNPEPQPIAVNGEMWFFDGQIYEPGNRGRTPTTRQLTEWFADRDNVPCLDGIFNAARYAPAARQLTVVNDILGYRPLFYIETASWFAFAGEVKALLAICPGLPEIDEISVKQYFAFEWILEDRTWWKSIKVLPPASVCTVNANGFRIEEYWNFAKIDFQKRDEAEVLEEFARLWTEAVAQRSPVGDVPVLLSGGLDSRLLVAELLAQERRVKTITFGSPIANEMRIARRVARRLQTRHTAIVIDEKNALQDVERAVWQTDGAVSAMHLSAFRAGAAQRAGGNCSPSNLAGDLIFGGSYLNDASLAAGKKTKVLARCYKENAIVALDEVEECSAPGLAKDFASTKTDYFWLRQRVGRFTIYGPTSVSSMIENTFPSVSVPILRLIYGSLTDEQRAGNAFYRRFLLAKYPKLFRNIPWERTGRGLQETILGKVMRRIDWKWERMTGRRRLAERFGTAAVQRAMRADLQARRARSEALVTEEVLGGELVEKLFRSIDVGKAPASAGCLWTLEMYLRQAIGTMPRTTAALEVSAS